MVAKRNEIYNTLETPRSQINDKVNGTRIKKGKRVEGRERGRKRGMSR